MFKQIKTSLALSLMVGLIATTLAESAGFKCDVKCPEGKFAFEIVGCSEQAKQCKAKDTSFGPVTCYTGCQGGAPLWLYGKCVKG